MSNQLDNIRLYGTSEDSIVDGPGLRFSIFTQGCTHQCPGCHNPESQPLAGGYLASIDQLVTKIRNNKIIQGLTFSGGEPLLQAAACLSIAQKLQDQQLNIWIYSGYLYENIINGSYGKESKQLLSLCDVLVDGPFIQEKHAHDLLFKGSRNQRLIDLKKSAETGRIILWETQEHYPSVPSSW